VEMVRHVWFLLHPSYLTLRYVFSI
jgi:hypothetical protein